MRTHLLMFLILLGAAAALAQEMPPPQAVILATPPVILRFASTVITLDGSRSIGASSYQWDIGHCFLEPGFTLEEAVIQVTCPGITSYPVTLTINGGASTASVTIESADTVAFFIADPPVVPPGDSFTTPIQLDGQTYSGSVRDGQPLPVTYRWTLDQHCRFAPGSGAGDPQPVVLCDGSGAAEIRLVVASSQDTAEFISALAPSGTSQPEMAQMAEEGRPMAPGAPSPAAALVQAMFTIEPPFISRPTDVITLDGRGSLGQNLRFSWSISHCVPQPGFSLTDPLIRVTCPAQVPYPITLTVTDGTTTDSLTQQVMIRR
ncbi:MAG: hypothetical protein HY335_02325 [Deinococcus sp.]|nr:hypothetical protein [Deinococcus sp.]